MGGKKLIKILHQNCDPSLADDRSLPYTAYIVKYEIDEVYCYDIVMSDKQVDIFDHYWDRYREKLIKFKQTEGRVNPRNWPPQAAQTKESKKR